MDKLTRQEREQVERRELIIEKAEELVCQYGFANMSMDELAKVTELTKRTLYRYFTCKEDLVYAVALKGYGKLYSMIKNQNKKELTGYEKVRLSYYAYYEFFNKYPYLSQLTTIISAVKSRSTDIEIPYRKGFMELDQLLFKELLSMFTDGKKDGSIRSDVDINYLAFSSIFVAVGFFHILSVSGNTYTGHFGLNKEDFITFTLDMLIESLKSK